MTARRLVLIRHSKATQGEMDHERRLSDRGLLDAAAVGRWLADAGIAPDRVVVSTSMRTRETWEVAGHRLGAAPATADHRIYVNTMGGLLAIVHETPDDVSTLALVGHNPSIGELACGLDDGEGDERASAAIAKAFQTSGIACFELTGLWSELALGGARLTSYAAPRGAIRS
jgi:phosphohistidine phosphatase